MRNWKKHAVIWFVCTLSFFVIYQRIVIGKQEGVLFQQKQLIKLLDQRGKKLGEYVNYFLNQHKLNEEEFELFSIIRKEKYNIPESLARGIAKWSYHIGKKEEIDPKLILAIIQVESSYNPFRISKKNARGLMQVKPFWAKEFGYEVRQLHNVREGIEVGVKVLNHYLEQSNWEFREALYRYSGKSVSYVDKVLNLYDKWRLQNDRTK